MDNAGGIGARKRAPERIGLRTITIGTVLSVSLSLAGHRKPVAPKGRGGGGVQARTQESTEWATAKASAQE